jgi:hypothetical protein
MKIMRDNVIVPTVFQEFDGTWVVLLPTAPGRKIWNVFPNWQAAIDFANAMSLVPNE